MTTVLKLGGSVITDKESPETVDMDQLERLASDIAAASEDVILVHGGGSFGHHHADRHGVTDRHGTKDPNAVWDIHEAMVRLCSSVVEALLAEKVSPLPFHPLSYASRGPNGALSVPTTVIEQGLEEGFMPVTHGDGVVQTGEGVTVLSGDELAVALAEGLDVTRIGMATTAGGVHDSDGSIMTRIDSFDAVEAALEGSASTDVTGGMAGKVTSLLESEIPASIFGPDGVRAFLSGANPGTRIGTDPDAF